MAGWAARRAAGVVCVSQSVAEHCAQAAGIPSGKLWVIPNGVQLPAGIRPIPGAALGVGEGRRFLVYVGRLHPQKGLDWLLECLPPIFEQFSDCDLVLVGDGPERLRLQDAAAASGISERVHFAGWRAEIPQILAAATAFVLPSRWEGMPNALLEAMASGLPVVSTRAEGVAQILGDLAEAQSAEFGDRVAFSRRLSELLEDQAAAVALGLANRERVSAEFSWSRSIERYVRLYCELISRETGISESTGAAGETGTA
jgi:glycosyltransferase involved in cell wall biosynthesis